MKFFNIPRHYPHPLKSGAHVPQECEKATFKGLRLARAGMFERANNFTRVSPQVITI